MREENVAVAAVVEQHVVVIVDDHHEQPINELSRGNSECMPSQCAPTSGPRHSSAIPDAHLDLTSTLSLSSRSHIIYSSSCPLSSYNIAYIEYFNFCNHFLAHKRCPEDLLEFSSGIVSY